MYVIYTIKQMADDLDRSERTVKTALRELENAGLMGMPIPAVLRQAIDILNGKAETYTESRGER